jgi:putative aminopeptidase FrvX
LLAPLVDEIRTDALGNVMALKKGCGSSHHAVMLAAHMDEIGLMVTGTDSGFLRFTSVGGFDPRVLPGQEVLVHGRDDLPGLIVSLPPHVLPAESRDKVSEIHELLIDVGLDEAEVKSRVRIGDPITFRTRMVKLGAEVCAGKAMDDRAGVASLILAVNELRTLRHEWDVTVVATVQEEVGLKGALVSAYGIHPDLAVAVDVTHGDMPGVDEADTVGFSKGPAIGYGPSISPEVFERLTGAAHQHGIPWQRDPIPSHSGTDAWAMQIVREGVPTGLLSLPLRYMHTPVESLCLKNVVRTGRLLALFVAGLDEALGQRLKTREVSLKPGS